MASSARWNWQMKQKEKRKKATSWQEYGDRQGGFNPKLFENLDKGTLKRLGSLGLGPQGVGSVDRYNNSFNALHHGEWNSGKSGVDKWQQIAWEMGLGTVETKEQLDQIATRAEKLQKQHGKFLTDGDITGRDIMLFREQGRRSDDEFNAAVDARLKEMYGDKGPGNGGPRGGNTSPYINGPPPKRALDGSYTAALPEGAYDGWFEGHNPQRLGGGQGGQGGFGGGGWMGQLMASLMGAGGVNQAPPNTGNWIPTQGTEQSGMYSPSGVIGGYRDFPTSNFIQAQTPGWAPNGGW